MNQPSIMYTEVVFGPNFQAVVEILMSAFLATPGESNRLDRLALQHISASHVECLSSALWSTEAACMAAGREAAVRLETLLETIEQNQRRGAPAVIDLTTNKGTKQ